MNYEKLKEVIIIILLWLVLTVWMFKIFWSNNDLQKWLSLKQELWILIAKWMWEFWKYDKNLTTYAEEENTFSKTFWEYHLWLIKTNKQNWYLIPILVWWIWDQDWEVLSIHDDTIKNSMDIKWTSNWKPAFWNLALFNSSINDKKLFPFFVTRSIQYWNNECKNKLTHHLNKLNWWKTVIIWIESLWTWNTKKTLIWNWWCKFRTLPTNDFANNDCEKPWVRLCNVNNLSSDIFWYVSSWYLWIWFFKTEKEVLDFDSQYFWWNWLVLAILWESDTLMYALLLQI